jgi:hypothetical protein
VTITDAVDGYAGVIDAGNDGTVIDATLGSHTICTYCPAVKDKK